MTTTTTIVCLVLTLFLSIAVSTLLSAAVQDTAKKQLLQLDATFAKALETQLVTLRAALDASGQLTDEQHAQLEAKHAGLREDVEFTTTRFADVTALVMEIRRRLRYYEQQSGALNHLRDRDRKKHPAENSFWHTLVRGPNVQPPEIVPEETSANAPNAPTQGAAAPADDISVIPAAVAQLPLFDQLTCERLAAARALDDQPRGDLVEGAVQQGA